jgi:PAS domain S-box-containing protein
VGGRGGFRIASFGRLSIDEESRSVAFLASIKIKVFAVVAALTLALVGVLSSYFIKWQIESVHSSLEHKATSYAVLAAKQVESGLEFDDKQTTREVFASVAADSDVSALALYKADGTLLHALGELSSPAGYSALAAPRVHERQNVIRVLAPVRAREGARGSLVIELSTASLAAESARIRRVALGAGLAALVLGMAAAWVLGRSLARRLETLAAAVQAVASGELDGKPIHDASGDEVGRLARAFGAMRVNLRALVDQIREAGEKEQERLDTLVSERTGQLNASRDRYKRLVESTHAIPWEMDGSTLWATYVSPQATKLVGCQPSELMGTNMAWEFVHPDDRVKVRKAFRELAAREGESDLDIEYRCSSKDGRVVDVRSIVTTSGHVPGERGLLRGVTLDVTAQKKLEVELRQAQKLESVGRLASGVAHEINTPVQFVGDSVHFARDAIADLIRVLEAYRAVQRSVLDGSASVEAAEAAARVEEEADLSYLVENLPKAIERSLEGLERVATIVRSMKEFAHPDQKEMTSVDLNRAIESTLVIAKNEYKYVADVDVDFGDIPLVTCHGSEVNQVVLNIVVNAAHAIGDLVAGSERRGRIGIQTRRSGDFVVIRISDTGGGIPKDIRERVFDPFFTTKAVGKGTGQGLAIARSVVIEKHHGELSFETEEGHGTTFVIRLPVEGARSRAEAA